MKFVEFTVLSSVNLLEKYGPSFYRSNKFIIICSDEEVPYKYRGNYCYNVGKSNAYYGFSFSFQNGQLFINKNGEQKIINLSSKFAIRIVAPPQEAIERVCYTMLYSSEIEQEVVGVDSLTKDEQIVEEVKNEPVLLEEEQQMEIEEEAYDEAYDEVQEELYESEEELEEQEIEEDDYEESEG